MASSPFHVPMDCGAAHLSPSLGYVSPMPAPCVASGPNTAPGSPHPATTTAEHRMSHSPHYQGTCEKRHSNNGVDDMCDMFANLMSTGLVSASDLLQTGHNDIASSIMVDRSSAVPLRFQNNEASRSPPSILGADSFRSGSIGGCTESGSTSSVRSSGRESFGLGGFGSGGRRDAWAQERRSARPKRRGRDEDIEDETAHYHASTEAATETTAPSHFGTESLNRAAAAKLKTQRRWTLLHDDDDKQVDTRAVWQSLRRQSFGV